MSANKMLEMEIRAAYIFLREKNQSIPSDTLQFMLDASLEKLNSVEYNEVLDPVSCSCYTVLDEEDNIVQLYQTEEKANKGLWEFQNSHPHTEFHIDTMNIN